MTSALQHLRAPVQAELLDEGTLIGARPTADRWGSLPTLGLTSALGVSLVALAGDAGRVASRWADLLFWLGLLVLFLPIARRLLSPKPARWERIALLVVLGSALYLIKYLDYPLSFAYNDDFIHWRGAQDLAASGHLFRANRILPISAFYPGLEILTNALSSLTGLSIFDSGMIELGVAGILLILALYLFYEHLGSSPQVAGIATLLYTSNPAFFTDTQFVYEALAVSLTPFVLFAIVLRSNAPTDQRRGLTLLIWLGLAAVVITHHATSYALVAFLLVWTATFPFLRMVASFHRRRDQKDQAGPGGVALLGLILCVVWLAYTGNMAVRHLGPYLDNSVHQLRQIIAGESAPRHLFHDATGFVEPLWERLTAFASVGLISLGLPFGLFQMWRHYRANAVALALAVAVLAYPPMLAIRLTPSGVNFAGRAQSYLYAAVAFVVAIGITHFWLSPKPKWRYSVAVTGAIVTILIGGWITGTAPLWARLPGPYIPSADQRSIDPESVTAAQWAGSYLGSGHRMISDRVNTNLMATYGNEWVVTNENSNIVVSAVFNEPHFDSNVEKILRRGMVQYIVVERRLSTGRPRMGFYFDSVESEQQDRKPIDPAALAKFDSVKKVSRLFDSGDIVIYDVEAIARGPSTASTLQSSHRPTPTTVRRTSLALGLSTVLGLLINPNALHFGPQRIGTTSVARQIHVVNVSPTPLAVTNVTITGNDAGDFTESGTCRGATIGVYGSCTVSVRFTPTTRGTRSASLVISGNAAGSPQKVPLSGQG